MDIKKEAEAKVLKARAGLIVRYPFLGHLALRLEPVAKEGVPVTATDGRKLYYNPRWVVDNDEATVQAAIVHQVLHCALGHFDLRARGDRRLWALAAELAVNDALVQEGIELPRGWPYHRPWSGMPVEAIYRELVDIDLRAQGWEAPAPPRADVGDGAHNGHHNGRRKDEPLLWELVGSFHETLGGESCLWQEPDEEGGYVGDGGQGWRALAQRWREAVAQARHAVRGRGDQPGHWLLEVKGTTQPRLDWRQLLRDLVLMVAAPQPRLIPPNRRFVASGLYLPSYRGEHLELCVAIDVSGSIVDAQYLEPFMAELRAISELFESYTVHLWACDTELYDNYRVVTCPEEWPTSFTGGGGTDLRPVFEDIHRRGIHPRLLVFFTDLMATFPEQEPDYPVVWVVPQVYQDLPHPWGHRIDIPWEGGDRL